MNLVETSESIDPNDNDLELNTIADAFSMIFQPEMKRTNFKNSSFGDRELLSFVCFPVRDEQEAEENSFTAMEDLTPFWRYSGTQNS